jgi:hypothetical protein
VIDDSDSAPSEAGDVIGEVDLGAAVWNVHKFGMGKIEILAALTKASDGHTDLSGRNLGARGDALTAWLRGLSIVYDDLDKIEFAREDRALATKHRRAAKELRKFLTRQGLLMEDDATPVNDDDPTPPQRDDEDNDDDDDALGDDAQQAPDDLAVSWTDYLVARAAFEDAWRRAKETHGADEGRLRAGFTADPVDLFEKTDALVKATKRVLRGYLAAQKAHNAAAGLLDALEEKTQDDDARETLTKLREALAALPSDKFQDLDRKANPTRTATDKLRQALHKALVVDRIARQFEKNKDLDAMMLNEVNSGVDVLKAELDKRGLTLFEGPVIKSGNYTEYYPLVVRKDGRVKHLGTDPSTPITFGKKDGVYRPIVVHTVEVDGVKARLGIVHTTPFGTKKAGEYSSEFQRRKVYQQLEAQLRDLVEQSEQDGIPLLIGGDYYLGPEARVHTVSEVKSDLGAYTTALQLHMAEEIWDRDAVLEEARDRARQVLADWTGEQWQGKDRETELRAETDRQFEAFFDDVVERYQHARDSDDVSSWVDSVLVQKNLLENQTNFKELMRLFRVEKPDIESSLDIDDSLMNQLRNMLRITSEAKFSALGLDLLAPLTGTNWKTPAVASWFQGQIADYFLAWRKGVPSSHVGIAHEDGTIHAADDDALSISKYWQIASDHFLVAGYFRMLQYAPRPQTSPSSTQGTPSSPAPSQPNKRPNKRPRRSTRKPPADDDVLDGGRDDDNPFSNGGPLRKRDRNAEQSASRASKVRRSTREDSLHGPSPLVTPPGGTPAGFTHTSQTPHKIDGVTGGTPPTTPRKRAQRRSSKTGRTTHK